MSPTTRRYDWRAMKKTDNTYFDPDALMRAKQASRAADERALASGEMSVAEMRRKNDVFAPLARRSRINLSASRSLS